MMLPYVLVLLLNAANAHTFLSEPAGALRPMVDPYCQSAEVMNMGPLSSPCCNPKSKGSPSKTVWKRGQVIPISWVRNNHPGGVSCLSDPAQ
jgi:hypothetical protein